jgi:outer membrane protein assembly factor BamE (lipoprotein component of BamABCDE complex)
MKSLALLAALGLAACAQSPNHKIALLRTGMTKQELVALLGEPTSTTNNGALTTYNYDFSQRPRARNSRSDLPDGSYYVVLGRDDTVRSFNHN